jgi:polar amino acid transport system permease protein
VLVIGLPELTTTAQLIYGRTFQQIPLLIVASVWYLVLTTILTLLQSRIERRMSRGTVALRPRMRNRFAMGVRP